MSIERFLQEPSGLQGDWVTLQECNFWSADGPGAVRYAIEKMTGVLLKQEEILAEAGVAQLAFSGTGAAGGNPVNVRLVFEAVIDARMLYRLQVTDTAPRKWTSEARFLQEAKRRFGHWCSQLELAHSPVAWAAASPALLAQAMHAFAAEQAIAALATDDATAIGTLQTQVCAALRSGKRLGTASHEGGTRIYFDGQCFVREAFGEQAEPPETFDTDLAMLQSVRALFAGEAGEKTYPHPPSELQTWQSILGKLLSKE